MRTEVAQIVIAQQAVIGIQPLGFIGRLRRAPVAPQRIGAHERVIGVIRAGGVTGGIHQQTAAPPEHEAFSVHGHAPGERIVMVMPEEQAYHVRFVRQGVEQRPRGGIGAAAVFVVFSGKSGVGLRCGVFAGDTGTLAGIRRVIAVVGTDEQACFVRIAVIDLLQRDVLKRDALDRGVGGPALHGGNHFLIVVIFIRIAYGVDAAPAVLRGAAFGVVGAGIDEDHALHHGFARGVVNIHVAGTVFCRGVFGGIAGVDIGLQRQRAVFGVDRRLLRLAQPVRADRIAAVALLIVVAEGKDERNIAEERRYLFHGVLKHGHAVRERAFRAENIIAGEHDQIRLHARDGQQDRI